jgi:hypothetical protein
VSQTSRSRFAGMTASEILNPAGGPDAPRSSDAPGNSNRGLAPFTPGGSFRNGRACGNTSGVKPCGRQ